MNDNPPFDHPYISHAKAIEYAGPATDELNSRTDRIAGGAGTFSKPAKAAGKAALILNVPFAEKDQVKRLGARWDAARRKWYVPQGVDTAPFRQWWPEA